jgi:secreted trypsin-like serine protease
LEIYLGANDLGNSTEFGKKEVFIKEIIIHSKWSAKAISYDHDIALIRLRHPVEFNGFIQPICLMTTSDVLDYGKVAGWGVVDDYRSLAKVAKIAHLKTSQIPHCLQKRKELVHIFWPESFCAESIDQGVCPGDSGSGFYFEISGKFFLKGLVSSSTSQRCTENKVALYSDIAKYLGFIKVEILPYIHD